MKIKIDIDCETIEEVMLHFRVIKKDVKRVLVRHSVTPVKRIELNDSNCYGDHWVTINNTGKNETI